MKTDWFAIFIIVSGVLYYCAFCFYRQWMQNKEYMKNNIKHNKSNLS